MHREQNELYVSIGRSYADYGCRLNGLAIEELFEKYDELGFIDAKKSSWLAPHRDEIERNWRSAVRGGELIHWFATYGRPSSNAWATVCCWRSSNRGWVVQHLVSTSASASAAVMLGGLAVRIRDGLDSSYQHWYQPTKRLPRRVFGSLVDSVGDEHAAMLEYDYLFVPPKGKDMSSNITVKPWTERCHSDLLELVGDVRGEVFIAAEGLGEEDVLLSRADQLFSLIALRRYRRIWLAYRDGSEKPLAALIAHRGPLGLSFSFIENRADLLVADNAPRADLETAVLRLLACATPTYSDFSPGFIPVATNSPASGILEFNGARRMRRYAQMICLADGFEAWYRHVDRFYGRVMRLSRVDSGLVQHVG